VDQNGKLQDFITDLPHTAGGCRGADAAWQVGRHYHPLSLIDPMLLLRSFIAIAAGFACMALLTAITTLLIRWLTPSWADATSRTAQIFNLVASCLYGALGGRLTATIARSVRWSTH